MKFPGIRTVPTPATTLVAICKKCGKKIGGGFGDDGSKSLAKALVKTLGLPKWKRSPIRIVETGCMKLCPRGAVAVSTSRNPGLVYVVPTETPVIDVATQLELTTLAPTRHPHESGDPSPAGGDGFPLSRE